MKLIPAVTLAIQFIAAVVLGIVLFVPAALLTVLLGLIGASNARGYRFSAAAQSNARDGARPRIIEGEYTVETGTAKATTPAGDWR